MRADHPDSTTQLTVFYDGACPQCRRDRRRYEWLSGTAGKGIVWFDITGQEHRLRQLGIDPQRALTELHLQDAEGKIVAELDAYIALMQRAPLLRPLAWLLALTWLRPWLARRYHTMVEARLCRQGRLKRDQRH